jgi:hypothetical protein
MTFPLHAIKSFLKAFLPDAVLRGYRCLTGCPRRIFNAFTRVYVDKRSGIYPILATEWGNIRRDLHPVDRRMDVLREHGVAGMATENISYLINELVKRFARNGVYCEVGVFQGYSLVSAALFNPSTRCIGIDNFSEFNTENGNCAILRRNLDRFELKNAQIHNDDYRAALRRLFLRERDLRINVYYYDGRHDYHSQVAGLEAVVPFLAPRCVILVDDINLPAVEKANAVFIKTHRDFRTAFRIKTRVNGSRDWWNGFEVITRLGT